MKSINLKSVFTVLTVLFSLSFANAQEEWPCTVINVDGGGYTDKVWAFSAPGTTEYFDNGYEGYKFLNSNTPAPQIFVISPDGNFQISSNSTIHNRLIGFIPSTTTEYTLTFNHYNLTPAYPELYLIDYVADSIVDVHAEGCTYSFTADVNDQKGRFKILAYITKATKPDDKKTDENEVVTGLQRFEDTQNANSVRVFSYEKNIVLDNKKNQCSNVQIIDARSGKIVKETRISENCITTLKTNIGKGLYVVSVSTENGIENTKVMIN